MIETYKLILLEIDSIFEKENLIEKLNQIYISFDDVFIDSKILPDEDMILKLYYNSYQGLFLCFKLMDEYEDVKNHFEKFAKIFEELSKISKVLKKFRSIKVILKKITLLKISFFVIIK